MNLPDETLLLETKLPDIRVTIIFYIFCSNVVFCMGSIFLGAIPYFYYLGAQWTYNGLIISVCGWIVSYIAMAWCTSRMYVNAIIGANIVWWLFTSAVVGFVSATIYNIAPIQFILISWAQSMVMVMYTVQSPHNVEIRTCTLLMIGGMVIVWLASVYMFLIEHDWLGGSVILILGGMLVAYNTIVIQRTESRYDASWKEGVRAVSEYYCRDLVEFLGA